MTSLAMAGVWQRLRSPAAVLGLLVCVGMAGVLWAPRSHSARAPSAWPQLVWPTDIDTFVVAEDVSSNGLPMRLEGFTSSQRPDQLVAWFQTHWGEPLMQDTVEGKTVLGKALGEHYVTVQLERANGLTHGVVATSDLRRAEAQHESSQALARQWQADLPTDTQVLHLLSSFDDGRASVHLVARNHQPDEVNVQRAIRALEKRGFAVERAFDVPKGAAPGQTVSSRTVLFKSAGREATLVAFHDPSGGSSLVINTQTAVGTHP